MSDFISLILFVVIMIIVMFVGINALNKTQCLRSYEEYKPQYTSMSGCRIFVDGKLTPVDIVRELN